MRAKRTSKDEQIRLIMECRRSRLSDYQWCGENGILPGTFYNWISRLRKKGYAIPETAAQPAAPVMQEVVKLPVVDNTDANNAKDFDGQNTRDPALPKCQAAVEIEVGSMVIRLYNGTDTQVVQSVLQLMGGAAHA